MLIFLFLLLFIIKHLHLIEIIFYILLKYIVCHNYVIYCSNNNKPCIHCFLCRIILNFNIRNDSLLIIMVTYYF